MDPVKLKINDEHIKYDRNYRIFNFEQMNDTNPKKLILIKKRKNL